MAVDRINNMTETADCFLKEKIQAIVSLFSSQNECMIKLKATNDHK